MLGDGVGVGDNGVDDSPLNSPVPSPQLHFPQARCDENLSESTGFRPCKRIRASIDDTQFVEEIVEDIINERISPHTPPSTLLARFLRKLGRHKGKLVPLDQSPLTQIAIVSRNDYGLRLLRQQRDRIEREIESCKARCEDEDTSGNVALLKQVLAKYFIELGQPNEAIQVLGSIGSDLDKHDQWLLEIAKLQYSADTKRQKILGENNDKAVNESVRHVQRRKAADLSIEEFSREFAEKHRPVIITGCNVTQSDWTRNRVVELAGHREVTLKRKATLSDQWAGLEDAEQTTLAEFCSAKEDLMAGQRYLFDWSIPHFAPELAAEIKVPKYFANDLLVQCAENSLYKGSWPSLFIAPAEICSELHVDTFGSNFWMGLCKGRKKWIFFDHDQLPLLYPRYRRSLDACFDVDVTNPDFTRYPALRLAYSRRRECILEAGEVLFVPAGSPHFVQNLTDTVAISGNFVDGSNFDLAVSELRKAGLQDCRAAELSMELQQVAQQCLK